MRLEPFPKSVALRACQVSFIFAVAAFAWLRFSDNTVDNDLWGHVLYGQRIWARGGLERFDVLSWTAAGAPWINHEFLSEIILGLTHRFSGGTGLWLLMVGMAAVTSCLASREGFGRAGVHRWTALALLAVSANFIATGYAVRPQLFTMLALVLLLQGLRRIDEGRLGWAFGVPIIFLFWVNLHGGFLLGILVLFAAAGAASIEACCAKRLSPPAGQKNSAGRATAVFWLLPVGALAAALCNPWGWRLLVWTAHSVLLPRPQITEWQPPTFSGAYITLFIVMFASLTSWCLSRRKRRWWEAAVLVLLAVLALQHRRHAPLFGLANLMLTPPHIDDMLSRLAPRCRSLLAFFQRPYAQYILAVTLSAGATGALVASVSPPRIHPFTLEIERDVYPVEAIAFMRDHRLTGKTITFFDWGQQVLWELPNNPVSFDGRLDTVYPPSVMEAHWRFYRGENPGPGFDPAQAEVALLPTGSGATTRLLGMGWIEVYQDPLASVLVKNRAQFAGLANLSLPFRRGLDAVRGREPFPAALPALAAPHAPR